jgi:hypothetical protein
MSHFQITPRRLWQSRVMWCMYLFVIAGGFYGCIKISNAFNAVPPGMWRATLHLSVESRSRWWGRAHKVRKVPRDRQAPRGRGAIRGCKEKSVLRGHKGWLAPRGRRAP